MSQRIERALAVMVDPCSVCEGAGHYWDDQTNQPDEPYGGSEVTCHACGGTGELSAPCIHCGEYDGEHEEGCSYA